MTTTTGFELKPNEIVNFAIDGSEALFAVAASGTQAVHVLLGKEQS